MAGPTHYKFRHYRAGRLIWASSLGDLDVVQGSRDELDAVMAQAWQSNALLDQGEQDILAVYFQGGTAPASFYFGLATAAPGETATLAGVSEVAGTGYGRIAVARNGTDWPTLALNAGDYQATSATKTFTAGGTWTGATDLFLATSSDNTGKLLATSALSATRTLQNTDTLQVSMAVKLA